MSKYTAEFLGTFVFVLIILFSVRSLQKSGTSLIPFVIGMGLIAGIFVSLGAGGDAHLNPAVSSVFLIKGDLTSSAFGGYVMSQLAGAVAAYLVYKYSNVQKATHV